MSAVGPVDCHGCEHEYILCTEDRHPFYCPDCSELIDILSEIEAEQAALRMKDES